MLRVTRIATLLVGLTALCLIVTAPVQATHPRPKGATPLRVALVGLAAIVLYKLGFTGFKFGQGFTGLALHMQHEWVILANLFLLLMGFALLSRHFEESKVPDIMPAILPDDWKGAFVLLVISLVGAGLLGPVLAAGRCHVMASSRHEPRTGPYQAATLAAFRQASNASARKSR